MNLTEERERDDGIILRVYSDGTRTETALANDASSDPSDPLVIARDRLGAGGSGLTKAEQLALVARVLG
jgi:hypothetical protein